MRVILAFLTNTAINFVIGLLVAKFLGPDQFGRFALALAIGMLVQTLTLEWIRLSTIRFYSQKSRDEQPELRATLDAAFGIISIVVTAGFIAYILSDIDVSLSSGLIGLAVAAAIANGFFDFHTAVVRARFLDRLYAQLVITKNIMALALTVGGAFISGSAMMTLTGACLSMAGSVLIAQRALADSMSPMRIARRALAAQFARYALPIVAANVLYLMIPLVNRSLVTAVFGFAETGKFSLAYDIGTRLIAAIGSALDVVLFQIAVRAEAEHGGARAREQVAQNMAIVFAILSPAAAGLWLVLPSVEQLIVPAEFRGPFGVYLTLMLPGLFCFGLMNFAINAVFQIDKKTLPLIAAAVAACAANPILFWLLPRGTDASSLAVAQAGRVRGGAYGAGRLRNPVGSALAPCPRHRADDDGCRLDDGCAAAAARDDTRRVHAAGAMRHRRAHLRRCRGRVRHRRFAAHLPGRIAETSAPRALRKKSRQFATGTS